MTERVHLLCKSEAVEVEVHEAIQSIVFAPKFRRQVIYGELRVEIGQTLRESCEQKGIEIGFDLRPSGALLNGLNDNAALCIGHDDLSSAKAIDLRGTGFDKGNSIPVSEYREAVIIAVHSLIVSGSTTPSTKS